jgi:hypothetical protein
MAHEEDTFHREDAMIKEKLVNTGPVCHIDIFWLREQRGNSKVKVKEK